MYIMGENPAMSDPDAHHAREALAKLEHLVVQEIFLTETCYLADVILPATAWPAFHRVTLTGQHLGAKTRGLPEARVELDECEIGAAGKRGHGPGRGTTGRAGSGLRGCSRRRTSSRRRHPAGARFRN